MDNSKLMEKQIQKHHQQDVASKKASTKNFFYNLMEKAKEIFLCKLELLVMLSTENKSLKL